MGNACDCGRHECDDSISLEDDVLEQKAQFVTETVPLTRLLIMLEIPLTVFRRTIPIQAQRTCGSVKRRNTSGITA